MITKDATWAEVVATAKERKIIGQTDVYLGHGNADDLDWSKCVRMTTGGSHRLDIYTSVVFHFEAEGLTLRWYFDIEKDDANGKGTYELDTAGITSILSRLPDVPKGQFLEYLYGAAEKVEKRGKEFLTAAQGQFGMAGTLRNLANA